MAINVDLESLIPFQQAAREIPGQPSISTLHRWRMSGVRGRKLETVLVGGIRFTSKEAIRRFIEAGQPPESPLPRPRSAGRRTKDSQAARDELGRLGV